MTNGSGGMQPCEILFREQFRPRDAAAAAQRPADDDERAGELGGRAWSTGAERPRIHSTGLAPLYTGAEREVRYEHWSAFHPRARILPLQLQLMLMLIHSALSSYNTVIVRAAGLEGVGRRPSLMLYGMVGISGTRHRPVLSHFHSANEFICDRHMSLRS